jgi:hypothetical protein
MKWKKLGIVYTPDGAFSWAKSHAMIPTPVQLKDSIIRVYLTFCDSDNIGRPGYVDIDAANPLQVLGVSSAPFLEIGKAGTFDENGILMTSIVNDHNGNIYMYYAGFELGTKIRYRLLTGLALSRDGGKSFIRVKDTPVLERSPEELYFRGGPYVLIENGKFRMWYVAGSEWTMINEKMMPVYVLKYLESNDGITWGPVGRVCIKIDNADEHGFGRPWVVKRGPGDYQLFYSVRRRSLAAYRLGYAESGDGINWIRKDNEMGLDVSSHGFDNQAIMYSSVITVGGKTYCFYNGNNFGEDGFAVAVLESK